MIGPAINVQAYDPKVAGFRNKVNLQGAEESVACHAEMHPIQVEPFGTNEVKISIDGISRIVDAFALNKAVNEALVRFRGRR